MSHILVLIFLLGCSHLPFVNPRNLDSDGTLSPADNDNFVIAGYLPEYRSYINLNATSIHLTDLMLFSLSPETVLKYADEDDVNDVTGGCCLASEHYEFVRKARAFKLEQRGRPLRLLITVGGGGRSDGFGDIVLGNTSQGQSRFLKGLVKLCKKEQIDGIDLDFEGIQSMQEWKAYLQFLVRASKYLHKHNLFMTVALHPNQWLPNAVCESVDRVHVMTYDMPPSQNNGPQNRNHHATLDAAQSALSSFVENGCPPSKLVMGIPAYARHERNMGLVKTYAEILDEYKNDGNELTNESIDSMQSWKGFQFDSPKDVSSKVDYAKQYGLGGIFIWELGQDKQMERLGEGGILLEAAVSGVKDGNENSIKHEDARKTNLEEL